MLEQGELIISIFNDLVRLQFLQEAAEYILANSVEKKGEVSFMKRFKEHVKRLRSAFNICSPAGVLSEEEVMWSQCMMGICSYVMKMTATEHDVESTMHMPLTTDIALKSWHMCHFFSLKVLHIEDFHADTRSLESTSSQRKYTLYLI